jgi:hypothetical protein
MESTQFLYGKLIIIYIKINKIYKWVITFDLSKENKVNRDKGGKYNG